MPTWTVPSRPAGPSWPLPRSSDLARRWSARTEDIERAARTFRQRYGREPRAGELGAMTVATRGTKTALTRVDVDQAWRAVGEEHGLSRARSEGLFAERPRHELRPLSSGLLDTLARDESMVERRELDARAAELAAGVMRPSDAQDVVADLTRAGELVELDVSGGRRGSCASSSNGRSA